MKRIRYADSGFRTLKPKIFRIRKSILQQISYFTFIKASQSENYGMHVYYFKKLKNICFTFLSCVNRKWQRRFGYPKTKDYHHWKFVSTIFEIFLEKLWTNKNIKPLIYGNRSDDQKDDMCNFLTISVLHEIWKYIWNL